MNDSRGRGLAERLLGPALVVFVAAWLLAHAVRLVESVLVPLLMICGVLLLTLGAWRWWRSRQGW